MRACFVSNTLDVRCSSSSSVVCNITVHDVCFQLAFVAYIFIVLVPSYTLYLYLYHEIEMSFSFSCKALEKSSLRAAAASGSGSQWPVVVVD